MFPELSGNFQEGSPKSKHSIFSLLNNVKISITPFLTALVLVLLDEQSFWQILSCMQHSVPYHSINAVLHLDDLNLTPHHHMLSTCVPRHCTDFTGQYLPSLYSHEENDFQLYFVLYKLLSVS